MSPSVLIYSWINKSISSFCEYNNCIKDSICLSDSMNKTPTPFEPSSVFIIIGYCVSKLSNAFFQLSSLGINAVLGCVNPKSINLI